MYKENFRAFIAWVTVSIIWGTTYLAIRIGVEDLPPLLFAGLRWLSAGLIFVIFLRLKGKQLPALKDIKHIAVVGIALLGLGNGLVVIAEQWIPSGLTAIIITTLPFWIVVIEYFLPTAPKANKYIIAGLLLGFAGMAIIFWNDIEKMFETQHIIGMLSLLGAIIFWSAGSVYSKYKKVNVHPLMNAAVQMLIAGTLQLLLGLFLGELPLFHLHGNGFWALIYLIIAGSLFGYGSYIYAIAHLPLSFVSTYAYINPVIAIFLGWFILGEGLSPAIFIAMIIIFAGVAMVRKGSTIRTRIKSNIPPADKVN